MSDAVHRDVVCPFCGLGCDDLTVASGPEGLRVTDGACPAVAARFAAPAPAGGPSLNGAPASLDAAIARAAQLVAGARLPLIAGLATDVTGVRAALALADRAGGVVDHLGAQGLMRTLRTLQDAGAFTTTLSEVRARADLLLLVGPDPLPDVPRLLERCFTGAPTLARSPGAAGRRLERLDPPLAELPAAIASLRALVDGGAPAPGVASGAPLEALRALAAALAEAHYPVVAFAPARLALPHGELVVEALLELVRALNRDGRASGLALGGANGLTGANLVCAWQTGQPLRTAFGPDGPQHDAEHLWAERLLAGGEADALVWVGGLSDAPPPAAAAASGVPTVWLGGAPDPAAPPAVHIPVGVPGLDHAGQIFRLDGVVALPLRRLRDTTLPSAAEVLGRIRAALG